jgi:hypothetical protein
MLPPYADAGGAGLLALAGIVSIPLKSDDTSTSTFVISEVVVFGVAAFLAYSAYTGHKASSAAALSTRCPRRQ